MYRFLLTALAVVLLSVQAQDWNSWGAMMQDNVNGMIMWDTLRAASLGAPPAPRLGDASLRGFVQMLALPPDAPTADPAAYSFAPSEAARQEVGRQFLADLASSYPAEAAYLTSLPLSERVLASARSLGLDANNYADANVALLLKVWQLASQRLEPPESAEVQGVQRQVYASLQASPLSLDAATLRSRSGNLYLQTEVLSVMGQLAADAGPDEQLSLAEDMGRFSQELFGLDFRQLELSAQGFTAANPVAVPETAEIFAGDGLRLSVWPGGDGYTGQINFGGQTYPLSLTLGEAQGRGVFRTLDGAFDFTVRRDGDALLFETGGAIYRLFYVED